LPIYAFDVTPAPMLTRRNLVAGLAALSTPAAALPAITNEDRLAIESALLARIEPLFAGVPMEVVESTLAHLTAKFFAGISPAVRTEILTGFEDAVLKLIPSMEQEIGAPWAKKS
jgi:hypothetical protein